MIGPTPEHGFGQIGPACYDRRAFRACSDRLVETDKAKLQSQWFEPKDAMDWSCKNCSKPKSGHYGAPWLPSAMLTCPPTQCARSSKGGRVKGMQRSNSDPSFELEPHGLHGINKFTQHKCEEKSLSFVDGSCL